MLCSGRPGRPCFMTQRCTDTIWHMVRSLTYLLTYLLTHSLVNLLLLLFFYFIWILLDLLVCFNGARCSCMVECSLVVRSVVGSILHDRPTELFLVQLLANDWCNKCRGMNYLVCGMVHIQGPLLLIGKSFLSRYLNGPLTYVRVRR